VGALNQLLEVLLGYIESAKFWVVVEPYEEAVVLGLGKFRRVLKPGLHGIIPFVEYALKDNVVPATIHVGPLSLTTKDGVSVIIAGVVTWSIEDIRTFLLDMEDPTSYLEESCFGVLGEITRERTWDQLIDPKSKFRFSVEKRMIRVMKQYGVRVEHFQFSDLTRSRTVRIMGWNGDE
jgi:regulator of protease activity HflC (stomatin/prohibitin superfamily)